MQLDPQKLPVICAGDFNSQGLTAVRELLTVGAVGPEFRESGDPTERGQEGKQSLGSRSLIRFNKIFDMICPYIVRNPNIEIRISKTHIRLSSM